MHVKPHHQQRQHVGQAVAHHGTVGYADDRTHTASTPAIRAASDQTADRSGWWITAAAALVATRGIACGVRATAG